MSGFRYFCSILTNFGFSRQVLIDSLPSIKFHGNPSGGNGADRRTDLTKVTGAFRDYANAQKNLRENRSLQPCRMTVGEMLICPHTHTNTHTSHTHKHTQTHTHHTHTNTHTKTHTHKHTHHTYTHTQTHTPHTHIHHTNTHINHTHTYTKHTQTTHTTPHTQTHTHTYTHTTHTTHIKGR